MPDYRITVDLDFSQKKLRLSPDRQLNLQASKVCACVCVCVCVWEGKVFECKSKFLGVRFLALQSNTQSRS